MFFTALKVISSIAGAVLKFLRKYWLQVLAFLICVLIAYAAYRWGYNVADNKWIEANNKAVTALNEKIQRLEKSAEDDLKKHDEAMQALQTKLDDTLANTPTITVHDQAGDAVQCKDKQGKVVTTAYLGREFKNAWNKLNADAESASK